MAQPVASSSADNKSQNGRVILWSVISLVVGLLVGHMVTHHIMHRHHDVGFTTPYQAVLLINGAVYYGKLSGYGTGHPVMDDVYYIMTKTDPETKQVSNVLVKRGKELHAPDRMYLNAGQIVYVEPVGPDSKVAQLMHEAEAASAITK